jgi:S1-C subfamily serine protease
LHGEIIGINEIRFGLSGAIPGNLAHEISDQLIAHGKIQRSWLGFDVQPLFKHSKSERGVLIGGVVSDSPASRAGLKAGDVLLNLADTPTNVRYDEQMPDLIRLVTSLPIGKPTKAVILRDGKEMTFQVEATERGELNPKQLELKRWG